ncbi:MAG: cellobiose phosphorylase, partial [Anaerolineales bacterium]
MQNYKLEENGRFTIEDYQNTRPFSSFLPGIAGPMGVPLWVFYVNRGQAIASFGVENKDKPILEFQMANRAYQLTSYLGFRTFIRVQRGNKLRYYEPFRPDSPSQKMVIGANELCLQEINRAHRLLTEVVYFLLPGENLAALVRMLTVINKSDQTISLEILDGLPAIIPFGVNNQILKDIGRTVEAWMEVNNLDQNVPYYRLRASVADTTEVSSFEAGHYMLAFRDGANGASILPAIVDPTLVFGQNTALSTPESFYQKGLTDRISQKQITCGRTPCGFSASQAALKPGESIRVNSLFGHVSRLAYIQSQINRLTRAGFLDKKRQEANDLVRGLTNVIACRTSLETFDAYCRQTFLDNVLRGGWPVVFGAGKESKVYYIYSRKHGDLERDYNAFSFAPEFYSQGNGSYRDVNQNRREDVWFTPAIGDFNIRLFMSLIQVDGYNPLVVQGSRFTVRPEKLEGLVTLAKDPASLRKLLSRSFSPGSLLKEIVDESISLTVDLQLLLEKVMEASEQHIEASSGEGYWIDHWTYNLDLIESYLAVYPDRQHNLLFSNQDLPFYDNALIVQPRSRKYVLMDGSPHQLGSIIEDHQKAALIAGRGEQACWLRTGHGAGAIYRTSLFTKLFSLALIKFVTLDPCGMGIEMEAGRPGWDDAMNGLPGLFGSSMP